MKFLMKGVTDAETQCARSVFITTYRRGRRCHGGLLFAPESGVKTRKRLEKYARRTAKDFWEQAQEAIETAADRGKEYFETGKEKAKEAIKTAAETVKKNHA